MSNPANNANLIGRLGADPKILPHKNGVSGTALITVYSTNNYISKATGQREQTRVDLEQYVRDVNNPGLYAYLKSGAQIAVNYHIANSDHPDKTTGEMVRGMKLVVDSISPIESKSAAAQREANRTGQAQPAQAVQNPVQQPAQVPAQHRAGQVVETINPNLPQPGIQAQVPAQQFQAVQNPVQQAQAVQAQPAFAVAQNYDEPPF